MPRETDRLPLAWYAAAWFPYAMLYVAIFVGQHEGQRVALPSAMLAAVANIAPAALLGLVVLRASRADAIRAATLRLSPARLARHAALAALYSGLLYVSISAALAVLHLAQYAEWRWGWIRGPGMLWQLLTGVMLYATVAGIGVALGASHRLRAAEQSRLRAELQALRGQLHPHFLFNTLHSVMALIRQDPPRAEAAVCRARRRSSAVNYRRSETSSDRMLILQLKSRRCGCAGR